MSESDYRRAHNLGEGTVAGAGLGNEFVLVDVTVSPAKEPGATTPSSEESVASAVAAIGSTPKCADQGTAYRLTGPNEGQLKTLVGRQVEIQGRFKDPTDPRTGEKLPNEVELLSFRAAPAPAAVSEPATPPPAAQTAPPAAQTPPPPPAQAAPPPPAQTAPPPPAQAAPPPPAQAPPTTTMRTELPRTATSTALLALVGVLALSSGFVLTHRRRRDR